MWRGFSRNFLHVDLVIAEGRQRFALRSTMMAFWSVASLCTTRMPRPPPPPEALMITG